MRNRISDRLYRLRQKVPDLARNGHQFKGDELVRHHENRLCVPKSDATVHNSRMRLCASGYRISVLPP
jgi:hypothetical protein